MSTLAVISGASRQPRFVVLLCLAWGLAALQLVLLYWAGTAETLLDTDDAMRLVEVRAFLAGQGWFDLTETRVAPPLGYETHWSRLIDAGLAGLFLVGRWFIDAAMAERLMRTVWPLLWLLPAMIGAAAIAWRLAGREAAQVTLLLAVAGLPALQQFKPGSIDHHNVQIALAVLTVAAAVWSDRRPWAAAAAGAVTGLALAIGLEGLPYLAVCGVALALRAAFDPEGAEALRAYGLALAASTTAAFLVTVAPDHWSRSVCDAIAVNLAFPVAAGGLVLALAARPVAGQSTLVRSFAICAIGVAVLAGFALIEPRCLGGPFAMVDPAVRSLWLGDVQEMQPLAAFARTMPVKTAAIMVFPLLAVLAAALLARDPLARRDFGFLVTVAAFGVAFATTVAAIKAYNYPMWLGMPLVAALALRLRARLKLEAVPARLAVALLLTPLALSTAAIKLAQATLPQVTATQADSGACLETANYTPLARLPAGVIATHIDFGPYLLALTPHAVLAAPYHRLSAGIIAAHDAFAAPPEKALRLLAAVGATYVVICGSRPPTALTPAEQEASLWNALRTGAVPDWLERMPETGQAFQAFRMKH